MSTSASVQRIKSEAVVIGGGIGGYTAAIRLGQLGKNVVLVERDKIGGVCLNIGCIPSKALITASKLVKHAREAGKMGIDANIAVDISRLQQWKQNAVNKLTSGVSLLCKANKVQVLTGSARLTGPNMVGVVSSSPPSLVEIECDNVVIATGSSSIELPSLKYDGKKIITSTEALELASPPKRFLIVGGGAIGLEIGMAYANLFGTELTIVELTDQLLPGTDLDLVNLVSRNLQKLGANIYLRSKVKSAAVKGESVDVTIEMPDNTIKTTECDLVLVSVGRKPNTSDLNLEKVGVELDSKGYLKVNNEMRTNVPSIFGIGDVVGSPLLAHKASKQGKVAAEVIAGLKSSFDNVAMPSAIFTDPEIAVVGMGPADAKAKGHETIIGRFPFSASGRALASIEFDGFTKVIADKASGMLLGVEIVGNEASDLISEGSLALEMGATLEDIGLTIHPHPSLSESVMEASENALGKAIHIQNRRTMG